MGRLGTAESIARERSDGGFLIQRATFLLTASYTYTHSLSSPKAKALARLYSIGVRISQTFGTPESGGKRIPLSVSLSLSLSGFASSSSSSSSALRCLRKLPPVMLRRRLLRSPSLARVSRTAISFLAQVFQDISCRTLKLVTYYAWFK